MKARLSQLGGRDGKLFEGSLSHAQKVEEVTVRLDPEGLSWMPVDKDRLYWKQMMANEFCKAVLTKS
ncbi:MAG: hypothetical protein SFY66_10700 [Oculatellaceae cyanobacterium bins.114]|nr:hypothetical protein [Oculatellaceae cyanobacterium bins.114]